MAKRRLPAGMFSVSEVWVQAAERMRIKGNGSVSYTPTHRLCDALEARDMTSVAHLLQTEWCSAQVGDLRKIFAKYSVPLTDLMIEALPKTNDVSAAVVERVSDAVDKILADTERRLATSTDKLAADMNKMFSGFGLTGDFMTPDLRRLHTDMARHVYRARQEESAPGVALGHAGKSAESSDVVIGAPFVGPPIHDEAMCSAIDSTHTEKVNSQIYIDENGKPCVSVNGESFELATTKSTPAAAPAQAPTAPTELPLSTMPTFCVGTGCMVVTVAPEIFCSDCSGGWFWRNVKRVALAIQDVALSILKGLGQLA